MSDPIAPFLGAWILDIEASDFEQGEPPLSGSYRIEAADFGLTFHMRWIDANGKEEAVSFTGMPGTRDERLKQSGLADALALYLETGGGLVSEARREGKVIMRAVRRLADNGATLIIEQTVHLPDDTSTTNTMVYRRAQ
ncbi:hypothetical protein [Breoghania sp. L-A4]|uniref:hypothetical protein n=1 Tax=Breoghania sp. L-A4 TaxID=2304600 RepID=UPI000E35F9E4|nr:hypothetical protein [Breoghania sp. L-A4]AXS42248.1 hypothetical protein D1F64_22480 [Breoghania sp. L-A4]